MTRSSLVALCAFVTLAACDVEPVSAPAPSREPVPVVQRTGSPQSIADFRVVARRVEPVAERTCRRMRPNLNCDFNIVIDARKGLPPNAYQTYDKSGRPIIAFLPFTTTGRWRSCLCLSRISITAS